MKVARHVIEKRGRYLVAIPAGVREHLGLVKGAQVWWHTTRAGDAALTTSGKRRAGRVQEDADCPSCAAFREEAQRLRTMLRTTTSVDYNTAFNQGVMQGQKLGGLSVQEFNTVQSKLDALTRLVAQLVVHRPRRRQRLGNLVLPRGVVAMDLPPGDGGEPTRSDEEAQRTIESDPPYADDFDGAGRLIPREPASSPPPPPASAVGQ
jgi:hypothetical protein